MGGMLRVDVPRQMLTRAPKLLDAMIQISQSQRWLQTSLNIIDLQQYLTQALWLKDNPFSQLPHLDVAHAVKGKGAAKSLKEYLKTPDDQKKGLASLSDSQVQDVFRVCSDLPQLEDVTFKFYVEDEAEIAEGDLVTLRVKFTRSNLKDGGLAPPVHAPLFPSTKHETWWVLVSYAKTGSLVLAEKITDRSKYVDFRVKLVAPPAASYNFFIDLKSSDYLGLDIRSQLVMKVVSAATLPEYKAHQEDLDLDDEPTLFEQVMNTAVDDSSEDEEETKEPHLSSEDSDDAATLTLAERRRRQARIKRKKAKLLVSSPSSPDPSAETSKDD